MRKFAAFLIAFLFPVLLFGQGYDRDRGKVSAQAEERAVTFQYDAFAFGVGSFVNSSTPFSTDAIYVPIQLHGVGMPFIKSGTSTGLAMEFHPTSIKFGAGGNPQLNDVNFRLWSVSRVPLSAIPWSKLQSGTPSRMFIGTDFLLDENGPKDFTGDYDKRFTIGGDLGILWGGNLVIEIYAYIENGAPVAVSLYWGY